MVKLDQMVRRAKHSINFLIIMTVSTVLSFTVSILGPQHHAQAATDLTYDQNREIRILKYYKDCLTNYLDTDGNDGNGRNKQFEGWYEVFKNRPKDSQGIPEPREVIAVGPDIDPDNGIWTCEGTAKVAISIYKPSRANDYQEYLMHELWGKSYRENGGPVSVNTEAVKKRAKSLIQELDGAISRRSDDGSARRATLKRFMPFVEQCYKNWSSTEIKASGADTEIEHPQDMLKYPGRNLYAERQTFDWNSSKVNGQKLVRIDQYNKDSRFPIEGKMARIGEIKLGFETQGSSSEKNFHDRTSAWFPIGNDLGQSVLGSDYKNKEGQTILSCNWIKAHNDYLFTRSRDYKYYLGLDSNELAIRSYHIDDNGNEVDDVIEKSQDQAAPGDSGQACGSGSGGGALRWILCPIISAINDGIDWAVKHIISPALEISPIESGGTLYVAWQGFRNMANAFLVLIFLLIIFANFISTDNSAYTVKKALPRIVAATILIQLSYFFCSILIDISNVLGNGIGSMIGSITGSAGGSGPSIGANLASGLLTVGGVAVTVAAVTILEAWVLLVPLAIGLVISILTLILSLGVRLIAINMLIMLSPIAILAWILPNTEKYSKLWMNNMLKLIMMYPLIIIIMASANVVVKVGAGNSTSTFASVLTLFAPMIAFFMIPATFKASGTVISGINNAISARGKSLSTAATKSMSLNAMQDIKDRAARQLYATEGQKGFKRGLARVASGNAFSFGATGQRKMAQSIKAARHKQLEAQVATIEKYNASNEVIGEMIAAYENGLRTYEYVDRSGKQQKIKLTDDLVAGGMKYLNDNSGQLEMIKLASGEMHYYTGQRDPGNPEKNKHNYEDKNGDWVDKSNKRMYDPALNGGRGGFIGHYGEIFKEATDGNAAALLGSATHLVHGAGAAAYKENTAKILSGLKGPAMKVAANVIKSDASGTGASNAVNSVIGILNDNTKAGGIDTSTARELKKLIKDDERIGESLVDLGDGNGEQKLISVIDKIITDQGAMPYMPNAKTVPRPKVTPGPGESAT